MRRPALRLIAVVLIGAINAACTSAPGASPSNAVPTPTASIATYLPSATPLATTPAPSVIATPAPTPLRVNAAIEPRPGVPSSMVGLDWFTGTDAGEVGSTAQLRVPSDELVLTAANGLVVSSRGIDNGQQYTEPVELLVREIRTGRLVLEVPTAMRGVSAALTSDRLFWAGAIIPADDPGSLVGRDGGVWSVALSAGAQAPTAIVPPGTGPIELGLGGRSPLDLSPTGRTLASTFISDGGMATDVIDTASLTVRAHLDGEIAFAVTDDVVVVHTGPLCDCPTGGVAGIDIHSKARLWAVPKDGDPDGLVVRVVAAGPELILQYGRGKGVFEGGPLDTEGVAIVGPISGRLRMPYSKSVASGPALEFVPQLSTPTAIGLARDSTVDSILFDHLPISILDPSTKVISPDVFTIESAW